MKKTRTRVFSILLACALVFGMMPMTAFAGTETNSSTEVIEVSDAQALKEAIESATDGTTITLKLKENIKDDVTISSGKNVILNLNGHTITNESSHTITVKNGATLTITGNGTVDNVTHAKAAIWNEGTVTLSGGTFTRSLENGKNKEDNGNNSYYVLVNHGTMTVNSGVSVTQDDHYSSLVENGYYSYNSSNASSGYVNGTNAANPELTINGGTFTGGLNTIKNDDGAILTINDGTFENTSQAAFLNWNVATVNGGTFSSDGNCILNGFGDENLDKGELTINGGSFISTNSAIAAMNNSAQDLSGVEISGGTFSSDVSEYCAEGYKTAKINNKTVVVTELASPVAMVGSYGFNKTANAVAAARNGDVVKLMQSTNDFSFTIPADIQLTLDLGGQELSMTGSTAVSDVAYAKGTAASLINEGTLTIQNGTIKGKASNTIINKESGTLTLASDVDIETIAGGCTVVNLGGSVGTSATVENNVGDGFVTYGGILTVTGGSIITGEEMSPIVVFNREYNNTSAGANVTVRAGILKGGAYAISTNNLYSGGDEPSNVTITGGNITAAWPAIYWPSSGTLTIGNADGTGPDITSTGGSAVEVCSGTVEIKGGNFVGQGKYGQTDDYLVEGYRQYSGGAGPGDAVTIIARRSSGYNSAPLNVSIAGGTFVSQSEYAIRFMDCNQASGATEIDQDVNVSVTGGNFAGAHQDIEAIFVEDNEKKIVSGGYFTSDPSAYVAEGKAALISDKVGYAFMVGEAATTVVDVTPAAGDPVVDMTEIKEEDQTTVKTVAESVSDNGALAAAANQAIGEVTNQQVTDATTALQNNQNVKVDEDDNVTVYAQTYLDIKPTAYNSTNKTMTLDITPMYRVVASTAESADNIRVVGEVSDNANAVVLENSEKKLKIQTMTISIKLPSSFVESETKTLYVNHTKNGRTYVYTGNVGEDNVLTFTNPHGFSEFTITSEGPVAELNGVGYASLTDAVNDAKDGDTVTIVKAVDLTASMSGSSRTIKLKNNTGSEITVTINDTPHIIEVSETYEYKYNRPSSGGGGGTVETKYDISVDSAANGTVKASASTSAKDKTVTLTVTPDEGYVLDTLTVTDKDGKNVELTKKSDTEYTFQMPSSKVTVKAVFKEEAAESTLPFTDVSDADWFYPAVKYVYDNDMMDGVGGSLFAPASQLTRGMIAQVLYNLEKVTGDFDGSFTDVAADEWYADAVNWVAECGIVNGFGDGTFGPEQNITREQMAQILMNYAKYKGYDMTAKGDVSAFTDAAEISGWAQDAVSWAVAEKLLSGKGNGILDPAGTATRAEVAQIFMNFCENIAK